MISECVCVVVDNKLCKTQATNHAILMTIPKVWPLLKYSYTVIDIILVVGFSGITYYLLLLCLFLLLLMHQEPTARP